MYKHGRVIESGNFADYINCKHELIEGDNVIILDEMSNGYYVVRHKGRTGLFKKNKVKIL